jgi:hypothetical protein
MLYLLLKCIGHNAPEPDGLKSISQQYARKEPGLHCPDRFAWATIQILA